MPRIANNLLTLAAVMAAGVSRASRFCVDGFVPPRNKGAAAIVRSFSGNRRVPINSNRMAAHDRPHRLALGISAAALTVSLARAPAAFAMDNMKKDTMSKDGMKKDTMAEEPAPFRPGIAGCSRFGPGAIASSGRPARGVRLGVAPFIGAFRDASLRVRAYGSFTAFPLPAGYPVGGMAGDQLRVTALHVATDHAGIIALLIVAWVLAWSRTRRGRLHAQH
jgi:hypothetical protein